MIICKEAGKTFSKYEETTAPQCLGVIIVCPHCRSRKFGSKHFDDHPPVILNEGAVKRG